MMLCEMSLKILKEMGVSSHIVDPMESLYEHSLMTVKINGDEIWFFKLNEVCTKFVYYHAVIKYLRWAHYVGDCRR